MGEITLVATALRDILPGEQLFYSYGNQFYKEADFKWCPCGEIRSGVVSK